MTWCRTAANLGSNIPKSLKNGHAAPEVKVPTQPIVTYVVMLRSRTSNGVVAESRILRKSSNFKNEKNYRFSPPVQYVINEKKSNPCLQKNN